MKEKKGECKGKTEVGMGSAALRNRNQVCSWSQRQEGTQAPEATPLRLQSGG